MPVVQVSRADNREQYEAVAGQLDMAGNRPPGLILHAASETQAGDVEIVDVWESAAAAEEFQRERLFPMFAAAGILEMVQSREPPVAYEPFDFVH